MLVVLLPWLIFFQQFLTLHFVPWDYFESSSSPAVTGFRVTAMKGFIAVPVYILCRLFLCISPSHEILNHPVLERMIADDDQPASGFEHLECTVKHILQTFQFLVHFNADGLEYFRKKLVFCLAWGSGAQYSRSVD